MIDLGTSWKRTKFWRAFNVVSGTATLAGVGLLVLLGLVLVPEAVITAAATGGVLAALFGGLTFIISGLPGWVCTLEQTWKSKVPNAKAYSGKSFDEILDAATKYYDEIRDQALKHIAKKEHLNKAKASYVKKLNKLFNESDKKVAAPARELQENAQPSEPPKELSKPEIKVITDNEPVAKKAERVPGEEPAAAANSPKNRAPKAKTGRPLPKTPSHKEEENGMYPKGWPADGTIKEKATYYDNQHKNK